MKFLRTYLRLLGSAPRGQVLGMLALMVLAGLTEGAGMMLLVPLLQLLQGGGAATGLAKALLNGAAAIGLPPTVPGLLAAFVMLVALRGAVVAARERLAARLQHAVVDGLRRRCFQALLRAEWRWVSAGRKGDHANLLITDVNRVGSGLHFVLSLAATLATLLVYVGVAFAMSWTVASLALASGLLVVMALMGQRRQALALGQGLGEANRALHAAVQDCLNGFKLTKILGNEDRHLDRFMGTAAGLRRQQLGFVVRTGRANAVFQVGGAALLATYLYLGLVVWPTPMPQLLALVVVFSRLIPLLGAAHQLQHHAVHALPAIQETEQLLADCQRAAEPQPSAAVLPWPVHDAISLREVVVTFDGRERPALDRLSLRLPARSTTAVIGPSGAGKSTLADVLIGLLGPDEGSVLVDGVPITGEQRMRWRHSVAYVPQEAFLLHDTIRGNLQWAMPQAGDADLREALHRAAADFVWQLPQGLDTVVGDGGVRLSGGERQRLALARALLRRPGLLILDEATSALDTDNERRVMQSIERLHGNMTVVIIGHRLPRLDQVDQVVLIQAGRAVAQGSWQQVQQWQEAHA